MSSGGKSSSSGTSVTRTEPPGYLAPYLTALAGDIQGAYEAGDLSPKVPTVSTVIPYSDATRQALAMIEGRATNGGEFLEAATGRFQNSLNGSPLETYLRELSSGGVVDPTEAAYRAIADGTDSFSTDLSGLYDTLSGDIIDRVNAQASFRGAAGSDAHAGQMTKALAEVFAPLAREDAYANQQRRDQALGVVSNQFGQDLARRGQGAQGLYDLDSSTIDRLLAFQDVTDAETTANADRLSQVGSAEETYQQNLANEAATNEQIQNEARMQELAAFNELLQGFASTGSTTYSKQPTSTVSNLNSWLNLANSGLNLWGNARGVFGGGAPNGGAGGGSVGTGIGSTLGFAAGSPFGPAGQAVGSSLGGWIGSLF